MNPWFAKAVVLLGSIAIVAIPHRLHALREFKVVKSDKGPLETMLLILVSLGFLLQLIWLFTPLLSFAEYPLRPFAFAAGTLSAGTGLWLFYRSHADLGMNWSISLELREDHELITKGVYRFVRHPMYLSLLLYSGGTALALPNNLAGPAYAFASVLLFGLRMRREEQMMAAAFGEKYAAYVARTRRLIPGVW